MTPLLPLESFRRILGLNPWHFWQLADQKYVPITNACNGLVSEFAWQDTDAAGRSEIAEAIETAEDRLRTYLGFSVAPRYASATVPARWPLVLPEGHVQALGSRRRELLGVAAVTTSDRDGDGLADTWTASVTTSVTGIDPAAVAVAYAPVDTLDSAEDLMIRPVAVQVAGTTITVTGPRWLTVKPRLYALGEGPIDPSIDTHFVSQVAIWLETVDSAAAGALVYDTTPCAGVPASTDLALVLADGRLGIVGRSAGCASAWCTPRPDRIAVNYLSGWALENGQMARVWQQAVARLAAADLERDICGCDDGNRALRHWQFDLARASGAMDEQYQIAQRDLDNPLGTRRGQVWAWRQIQQVRQARAVLA